MTQIKIHEEEIEGHRFQVFKLPPLEAQDLLLDILAAVGPSVGSLAGGLKGDDDTPITERELDPAALSAGIGSLVRALDKKAMRDMVNTLAEVSTVDGLPVKQQLPIIFREDLSLMYRWLWFALKVQYARFFALLPSGASGALGKLARAASSQDTSPGDGL
ncbi:hypothetical protein LCGC14_2855150 [marine sediment metagenome]|uniref:Uncharacterized protein n=1 Tax=marine sediment metagenome TaxID=412755 RepID=A0A0F9AFJ1_9ZZZZ